MEDAIKVYESLARPPKDALRTINGGKLQGMSDINPQWRYKAMTEKFGLVGIGWKYEVQKLWTEQGAGNEKLAFAQVAVFVKDGKEWSEAIVGIGGSKLVATERGSAVSNDEGYKMAVTDAFSTALKMIGVAADIYAGRWDGSKYKDEAPAGKQSAGKQGTANAKTTPPKSATPPKVKMKGGESTPAEKVRISMLLSATYQNGKPIFSREEKKLYSDYRKEKYTASELIAFIENALRNRRGDAPELQVKPLSEQTPPAQPQQSAPPPAQQTAAQLAEQALNSAASQPAQPSFDTMKPVENGQQNADQFDIF